MAIVEVRSVSHSLFSCAPVLKMKSRRLWKLIYQVLSLFVTMKDRYIEIEPYEEIVDRDEVFSTLSGSRSASPVSVDRSLPPAQSLSQGPCSTSA